MAKLTPTTQDHKPLKSPNVQRDLAIVIGLTVGVLTLLIIFDVSETFHVWLNDHEALEADEFFLAMVFLSFGMTWFSYRRSGDNGRIIEEKTLSEARFNQLCMSSPVIFYTSKATGDFATTYISQNVQALIGINPDDFLTDSGFWVRNIHPEDAPRVFDGLKKLFEQGIHNQEYRFKKGDGSYIWLHADLNLIRDDDGQPKEIVGSWSDITDRKKASDELIKLSSVVEQSPSMMFITNTEGIIEYANAKFYEVTGYSTNEIIGKTPRVIKSGNTSQAVYADLWKTIIAGKVWHHELEDRCKNGEMFWADVTISPVRSKEGVITHYFSAHENISSRKEAEERVQEAKSHAEISSRAKSDLMANMSHELRTPLNAIIGFSATMLAETFGPVGHNKNQEYLVDIHTSGQHLLELINDILDVSAFEAGALTLQEENISLSKVVEVSIRIIQARADAGMVYVSASISPNLLEIYVDERRLKQILLNLLSNAVKFTPEGGDVWLETKLNGDGSLAISVTDTGIGMDDGDIKKAMSKFGQVDSGLDRKHEGTGLGLPLTVGLMDVHGGALDVKSKKGSGTTVTVTFPKERVVRNV